MVATRVLALGGGYTVIAALSAAFQPPADAGVSQQALIIGENVVKINGASLSLPALSRTPGFKGPVYHNFGTMSLNTLRTDDGGRRLSPGLAGHTVRINNKLYNATFDTAADSLGHWLPIPSGTYAALEIVNSLNGGVSWHGNVRCDTQIKDNATVHLSLTQLGASVEYDRGAATVIVPASETSVAVTILSTFLSGIYLLAVAACCTGLEDTTTVEKLIGNKDSSFGFRLFIVDAAANSIGICVSGIIRSYSLIQSLRAGICLVGAVWSTAATVFMLAYRKQWHSSTLRMVVEVSLLSGISNALGVFSPLAQFSAVIFAVGAIVVALRDPPPKQGANKYLDIAFKAYTILVWAPAIFMPALGTSLPHFHNVFVSSTASAAVSISIAALCYTL